MTTKVSLIANNAVVSAGISNKTITNDDIKDSTITTNKITFGSALVPLGGIIMWSGSTAPSGYQLCNGSNLPQSSPLRPGITKTPDLRDKFIVGATSKGDGAYPGVGVNQIGGSADATLVSHTHTVKSISNPGNHYHTGSSGIKEMGFDVRGNGTTQRVDFNDGPPFDNIIYDIGAGSHTHDITLNHAGSSGTNANLPPYYALAFIMRVL